MNRFLRYILYLIALLPVAASAQKLPDYGLNRVRITQPDRTITAEIIPVNHDPSLETDRTYYWYSGNLIHTTQGGYSGKLLNGSYNEYYPNKSLKEQGEFKAGLKTGIWRSWNEAVTLLQLTSWKKGLRNGEFNEYDEQGRLVRSGNYRNDLVEGRVKLYHSRDSVETLRYHNGVAIKPVKPAGPSFWSRLWPFKKHMPPGEKKVKAPKPPKVKRQRKFSTPDVTAAP